MRPEAMQPRVPLLYMPSRPPWAACTPYSLVVTPTKMPHRTPARDVGSIPAGDSNNNNKKKEEEGTKKRKAIQSENEG